MTIGAADEEALAPEAGAPPELVAALVLALAALLALADAVGFAAALDAAAAVDALAEPALAWPGLEELALALVAALGLAAGGEALGAAVPPQADRMRTAPRAKALNRCMTNPWKTGSPWKDRGSDDTLPWLE
ncbi:MAG: hypothetical protein JOZ39_03120 [Chloroflexi bacterium]|nr:hypothetical protein [Chloroflexota bacterium]